jgi:hypothetical protein
MQTVTPSIHAVRQTENGKMPKLCQNVNIMGQFSRNLTLMGLGQSKTSQSKLLNIYEDRINVSTNHVQDFRVQESIGDVIFGRERYLRDRLGNC